MKCHKKKLEEILFTILLCSFSVLISTGIDSNQKSNAYGQTPDPSNSVTGIIPQNNYSQTQGTIYNSTSLANMPDSLNQTDVDTQNCK